MLSELEKFFESNGRKWIFYDLDGRPIDLRKIGQGDYYKAIQLNNMGIRTGRVEEHVLGLGGIGEQRMVDIKKAEEGVVIPDHGNTLWVYSRRPGGQPVSIEDLVVGDKFRAVQYFANTGLPTGIVEDEVCRFGNGRRGISLSDLAGLDGDDINFL